jgi:ribulose-phosphate 3-epimerase
MTVNPGFGGQSFIPGMLPKIASARRLVDAAMQRTGRPIWLEVDGGVKRDNARAIAAAGADTLVAGSAVFTGARDTAAYAESIAAIRGEALQGAGRAILETA